MAKGKNKPNQNRFLIRAGIAVIILSLCLLFTIFIPAIKEEVRYIGISSDRVRMVTEKKDNFKQEEIIPADQGFSVIIPKIGINVPVIKDVDPNDPKIYQLALTKGVAHAKGTPLPEEDGNTFIFAHSSDNFFNANKYNSIFYLLHKLEKDDLFYIAKDGKIYQYRVIEQSFVDRSNTEYMKKISYNKTTTLMTCWPPGTNLKRLVVVGEIVE